MKYFAPTRISENMHKTPEGYLLCIGVPIGRTGTMDYAKGETPLEVGPNGTVKVTRDADELFRPETMASFEGKSLTIKHPEDHVTPETWNELTVGILQNIRKGKEEEAGEWPLLADLLITNAEAIKMVEEDDKREVSCGYECGYIQTAEGEGKQIEIVGNHLALVDQGRAGPSFAINDHSAKENMKGPKEMKKATKLKDAVKALFSKAQDEAFKTIDEEMKEDKAKDESAEGEKKDDAKDAKGYDELVSMVKDLGEKISSMAKGASGEKEAKDADKEEPKEEEAKDDGEENPMEARMKRLEDNVAKLMEMMSEGADEDSEEGEEAEDDDAEEESVLTGDANDTAMRAEILAPGIEITKDVKAKALKTAYATKEGKTIIDALNGGRKLTFDSAEKVNDLFVSVSEVLKVSRSSELSKTKRTRDSMDFGASKVEMTPERMNEINAQRYGTK